MEDYAHRSRNARGKKSTSETLNTCKTLAVVIIYINVLMIREGEKSGFENGNIDNIFAVQLRQTSNAHKQLRDIEARE